MAPQRPIQMEILHNHVGFERRGPKRVVVKAPPGLLASFALSSKHDEIVHRGEVVSVGTVDNWRRGRWYFYVLDFSDFEVAGRYRLHIDPTAESAVKDPVVGEDFLIGDDLLFDTTAAACLDYFKSQRCTGRTNKQDHHIPLFGRDAEVRDVHGGWYDASGDTSKYLSHLSYANFMNPQQTPLLPWVFLEIVGQMSSGSETENSEVSESIHGPLRLRIEDEAIYGGDFLVRMQDPSGYFYMTVFDRWSKDLDAREICAFSTQEGRKSRDYQAGYRQGGGMAIAALAKLAHSGFSGDFTADRYLESARRAFDHLESHNLRYLDDGAENIIDDYCALMAAVELYRATEERGYLDAARTRAGNLCGRLQSDGQFRNWWRSDDADRPYFHAAEAGMPVTSLCAYYAVEPDLTRRGQVLATIEASLSFELEITAKVANPFGYARQYVRPVDGQSQDSFFFPHNNESRYWWQGENARLASLAAAALAGARLLAHDAELVVRLEVYARDQLDWILGRNPFDACMLYGKGRNNPTYEDSYPSSAGGICNGVTSGFSDESDIDLDPESCAGQGDQVWRWGEQWLPHAAWYMLAISLERDRS